MERMNWMCRLNLLALSTAIVLIFASCSRNYFVNDGTTWGTTYHIVYESEKDLHDSIIVVMRHIDSELSLFNPQSNVSLINAGVTDEVNEPFRAVFDCAAYVNCLSGGMFDPTIAPLTDLWGFGVSEIQTLPNSEEIEIALATVGLQECRIEHGRIIKKSQATSFDFSALAKGYGVDCVAAMLERNGCSNYMVEIGGEIVAAGLNPKGKAWRIQIDAPVSLLEHRRLTVIELGAEHMAIASSGNYRNYKTDSLGNVYGHIINPLNGLPVRSSVLAATISARDCMIADALATAAMCMPADSAMAMINRAAAKGLLVLADGDSLITITTEKFP